MWLRLSVGIIASVAVVIAAYWAANVFAPLTLAIFVIAIVWPLQSRLQLYMPRLLALAITLFLTIALCLGFASLAVWAFGHVGHSIIADSARYQAIYQRAVAWLDDRGVSVAGLWAEHFNVAWLLRAAQQLTGRLSNTLTFWLIALSYLILGLLEVDDIQRKIRALDDREKARVLLEGSAATAIKFRKYMLVRTEMSAVTGLLVGVFAWITGLPLAAEWGMIAFVLNYIPYIGPFVATLFPTLLALTHFQSWQAVLGIFVGLNFIQFAVGNYIEPRAAGSSLLVSPTVVLFAIFFWTFLWGLFGAFIGVPIALAILSLCDQHPSSRWVADLLGGPGRGGTTQIKTRS
jgi:predicted PurR-regulated permease PerM